MLSAVVATTLLMPLLLVDVFRNFVLVLVRLEIWRKRLRRRAVKLVIATVMLAIGSTVQWKIIYLSD
jgi:hypothetical protein